MERKHFFWEDTNTHRWCVVGEHGAVDVWMTDNRGAYPDQNPNYAVYGGVEMHSRTKLYDQEKPNHKECWLLDGPCWHDGSSLQFQERFVYDNLEDTLDAVERESFDRFYELAEIRYRQWFQEASND